MAGDSPPPPRRASIHTNLLPCCAAGECSNRQEAGRGSQSIGSEKLPLGARIPAPCPDCVVGLQRTIGQYEEVKGHVM